MFAAYAGKGDDKNSVPEDVKGKEERKIDGKLHVCLLFICIGYKRSWLTWIYISFEVLWHFDLLVVVCAFQ